jgi:hypothetical protein
VNTKYLILSITGILLVGYVSCSSPIRFNPRNPSAQNTSTAGNPNNPGTSKVLAAVCEVIDRCHSVSTSTCQSGVLGVDGLDTALGLPPGDYSSGSQMVQAEQSGAIVASSTATSACTTEIQSLSCLDPAVQSAYNSSASSAFAGVAKMIPTSPGSCPDVFTPPQHEYFVATTGSDTAGDGTQANPWATITHASQALTVGPNGAIVHVLPGVYSSSVACHASGFLCGVLTNRSGTSEQARITYVSDQKWGAKIQPSGAYFLFYNTGSYVDIVGFETVGDGETAMGIGNWGSYVRVIGNHVHSIKTDKYCASGSNGIAHVAVDDTPRNNDAIGNVVHDIGLFKPDGTPHVGHCQSSGIHIGHPGGRIHNNILYRLSGGGVHSWQAGSNMMVTNNLIFNYGGVTDVGSFGSGIIIAATTMGGVNYVNDHSTVANNIILNAKGGGVSEVGSTGQNNVYLNNLIFGVAGAAFSLNNGLTHSGTITADPRMVNFQVNGGGDYTLSSSSPAINAGTLNCADGLSGLGVCTPLTDLSGFNRPFGPTIDIGPYEYH